MTKYSLLIPGFFLLYGSAQAQILYVNGAQMHITAGVIVHANGGVTIANASAVANDGVMTVTKNSGLPAAGNFQLRSGAVVSGGGTYRVEQDWVNDATFNAGNSQVELYGNTQQLITSSSGVATTFNQLTLTGTGAGANRKKTLQAVNASISASGSLSLNDRELETQGNTFFVLNPAASAVSNNTVPGNEGFVSSTSPGVFSRVTNSAAAYLFPTGSSNGTLRYRPLDMTPATSGNNTYTARLNNNDATADGFNRNANDGSMCQINDLYYHSIDRAAGADAADITMYYIPASDGSWSGMGHWRNASSSWNDMNTVAPASSGGFSTLKRPAWAFADPGHPYALTKPRPAKPSVSCPSICENSSNNVFTLTGSGPGYQWTVPSNGTIVSGQGSSSINVSWTTGSGYVRVYATDGPNCVSLPDSCMPSVLAVPVAQFTTTPGSGYTFTDLSSNGTSWSWDFGDGSTSSTQSPSHDYSSGGTYTVVLIVGNGNCRDTVSYVIEVSEGITIPNVFTPNGDGVNDYFYIKNSGLKTYRLSIYNRWGLMLFSSENPTEKWDGTNNGRSCSSGTYYFVLDAKSDSKDYSTTGYITLIGSK